MSETDEPLCEAAPPTPNFFSELRAQLRPLLLSVPLLTLLTGVVFPAALAGLARPLFPHHANGSLLSRGDIVVGSELIGQTFTSQGYFHSRPSSAGTGYDGAASGGTNYGPANAKLRDDVHTLAETYRQTNGLLPGADVPIDAVTRSGSGLDPHISLRNAVLQAPRVARERQQDETMIRRLVEQHSSLRQFGLLGEPRVQVLALNLALDRVAPLRTAPSSDR